MKIAVIAKIIHPIREPFVGGLETFTWNLCREYVRSGHDVTLYAHPDSDPQFDIKGYSIDLRSGEESRQLEVHAYSQILRDIEQGDFDVVHCNSTHEFPIIWGARASVPIVVTLHTPPYTHLKAATVLSSYSLNVRFVAVSKSLKKMWQPFIHSDIAVIYNGIDLDAWKPSETRGEYLFWYGRILRNKGLDIALDLAHLAHLPLKFAGSVTDENYWKDEIEPRLTDSDTYLGHIGQKQIRDSLAGAKAYLNPTRWEEPFGLSTIEAMATGVPVIGFDRGAFREIVEGGGGIIASGTTVQSLADALALADDYDSAAAIQRAGTFPIKKVGEQYAAYFKELQ